MNKYMFAALAVVALLLVGVSTEVANAYGCHSSYYGGYPSSSYSYGSYFGGGWGGNSWHDTSHLDYHPGYYAPHRRHVDYVPGHYDVHSSGHWNHNHF